MKTKRSESGQAVVMLIFAILGLFAFAGLAVDGGRLYNERRAAQNAADSAAMAGAMAKCEGGNVTTAAVGWAAQNAYDNNGTSNSVTVNTPPSQGQYAGNSEYVEVVIDSTIPAMLIQLVYNGPLSVQATAVSHCSNPSGGGGNPTVPMPGFGIVTLGNCLTSGVSSLLSVTGGGNSGGIRTYGGDMYVNTPENAGNHCSVDPPNNGYGIVVDGGNGKLVTVGSYDYDGEDMLFADDVITGYNGGVPLGDPLAMVPEPTCNSAGTTGGGFDYNPGSWNGGDLGSGTYAPGIYCIHSSQFRVTNGLVDAEGAVFYLQNVKMTFTGMGSLYLAAPTADNCTGTAGNTSASCNYVGMALFSSRSNSNEVEVGGNGNYRIKGTVYMPNGQFNAHGGGTTPEEALVWGQVIGQNVLGNGNGTLDVWYREDLIYHVTNPIPEVSLVE